MIAFFIRNWKIFLDCIVVVAAILAFTYWDPLDFFHTVKLRRTATLVTSVRDIGELVTAEYYGEVISSWKGYKLSKYPEDSVRQFAEDMFVKLRKTIHAGGTTQQLLNGEIRAMKNKLDDKEIYEKFIAFLGDNYLNRSLRRIYKDEKLVGGMEERVIQALRENINDDYKDITRRFKRMPGEQELVNKAFNRYLDSLPPFIARFYEFTSGLTKDEMEKRINRKKDIVFIGRGWVKAGYRFGKFDESNFFYDEGTKTVHFYGLEPEILDKDINPWFIPERKVKGYELVSYAGDVGFEDAVEVKKLCKEKLLEQAGIELLTRARENGKEALQNFFGLLIGEPDLQVELHKSPYQEVYAHIAADTLVTINEAWTIDTLYHNELSSIRKLEARETRERNLRSLGIFLEKLKKLHFVNKHSPFNFYSLSAAKLLSDDFQIDKADMQQMLNLRGTIKAGADSLPTTEVVQKDSLWFLSNTFIADYNSTLDLLLEESVDLPGIYSDSVKSNRLTMESKQWFYDKKPILDWDTVIIGNRSMRLFFYIDSLRTKKVYPPDFGFETLRKNVSLTDSTTTDEAFKDHLVYNEALQAQRKAERAKMLPMYVRAKTREEQIKPLRKLTDLVNSIIQ